MAIHKSSRPRLPRARSATSSPVPSSRRGGRVARGSVGACLPIHSAEALRQLSMLVRRLRAIYGIAVTAEGALRHQAAEQDAEIADCLRGGVCDPVADEIRALQEITERHQHGEPRHRIITSSGPSHPGA